MPQHDAPVRHAQVLCCLDAGHRTHAKGLSPSQADELRNHTDGYRQYGEV